MDDADGYATPKKHKKHKHKKHKKKKEVDVVSVIDPSKIKSTMVSSSTSVGNIEVTPKSADRSIQLGVSPKNNLKKKKSKGGKDSGTSSDEERWLDAIQSGKLEEVDDELKKIKPKDPKLMTARQRAMLERKGDGTPDPSAEQLLSLPSGYREKVMTPEMIKKAAFKNLKRKQLLDEKREKDKKRTVERLLRKQDNKTNKSSAKRPIRKIGATIIYRNSLDSIELMLPAGFDYPISKQVAPPPPPVVLCAAKGCTNPKKYSCSKTKVPLCSLQCYKANLAAHNLK
ncbi:HIT zinc finger [Nesidiocoris tenuis]|uniref:HIT zinc finger n=1 Tax=Nesidiocoris tenuis TaxID=355587 RepID=A0ABN7AYJ3_9HEMI|nr:HIT zinc finger [Nesidiocoris tenuis]